MSKVTDFEQEHLNNLSKYEQAIMAIYQRSIEVAAKIGLSIPDFDPNKPFKFDKYPGLKFQTDKLFNEHFNGIRLLIVNAVESEWTLANNKNNEIAKAVFGSKINNINKKAESKYFSNNHAARDSFLKRKVNGLNLSDRVWKYTNQFKQEIEMGLDIGLRTGRSAAELSRDIRGYLQNPDKLFRRVRDAHGNLQLSKNALAYNPGRGVYRSSYKNARRLTATEGNMAYRSSDFERIQQFDFVLGIEIKLSNNHTLNGKLFKDMCDELAGKYPKEFKFTGWHVLCRCYSTTILADPEELLANQEAMLNGENVEFKGRITKTPSQFNKWIKDNDDRIKSAKNLPYFLKDNEKFLKNQSIKPKVKKQSGLSILEDKIKEQSSLKAVKDTLTAHLKSKGLDTLVTFPKTTSLDIAKEYSIELSSLLDRYNVELPFMKFDTRDSKKYYGCVQALQKDGTVAKYVHEVYGKRLNCGTNIDRSRLNEVPGFKSLCDPERLTVSTLVHEFAHLLYVGYDKSHNALSFATKLKRIKQQYYDEMRSLSGNVAERNKIYLGGYASKNEFEFMAEAFQEYKNKKSPSKYAKLVGELIDEHYGK